MEDIRSVRDLFSSLRILEICSQTNDLPDFIGAEMRWKILRDGPNKNPPPLIVKCLSDLIKEEILGKTLTPRCSFSQNEECNIKCIHASTLKILDCYGLQDNTWMNPYIEAAICKLLENNTKSVVKENGNVIVEYIDSPPIRNSNPRSLLKRNFMKHV